MHTSCFVIHQLLWQYVTKLTEAFFLVKHRTRAFPVLQWGSFKSTNSRSIFHPLDPSGKPARMLLKSFYWDSKHTFQTKHRGSSVRLQKADSELAGWLQVAPLATWTPCAELAHSLVQKQDASHCICSLLFMINRSLPLPVSKKYNAKVLLKSYLKQRWVTKIKTKNQNTEKNVNWSLCSSTDF